MDWYIVRSTNNPLCEMVAAVVKNWYNPLYEMVATAVKNWYNLSMRWLLLL